MGYDIIIPTNDFCSFVIFHDRRKLFKISIFIDNDSIHVAGLFFVGREILFQMYKVLGDTLNRFSGKYNFWDFFQKVSYLDEQYKDKADYILNCYDNALKEAIKHLDKQ